MLKKKKILAIVVACLLIVSAGYIVNKNKNKTKTPNTTSEASLNNKDKVFRHADSWPAAASYKGNYFNPAGMGWIPSSSTFEGLFAYMGVSGDYFNRLCKSYENTEGKTTVHLQQGVKWNDGQPFNSKDIRAFYTLNTGSDVTRTLEKIETPDDYTVVFTWQKPYMNEAIQMRMMASQTDATIPYHIYGKYVDKAAELLKKGKTTTDPAKKAAFGLEFDDDTLKAFDENWKTFTQDGPKVAVGTGPFMIQNVTDSDLIMVKNPYYWQKDKVAFEKINLKKVDSNTTMAMLQSGDLDRADGTPAKDVLESILSGNKNLVHYLTLDNASVGMSFNIQKAPLNNVKVRQAIAYILDRNAIKDVGNYYGKTSDYATLGMPYSYSKDWVTSDIMNKMTKYNKDTSKAASLLTEAGWTKGTDGKWKDKDGKVPNLIIGVTSQFQFMNPAQTAAEQISAFGIPTQTKVVDQTVFYQKAQTDHEYDMAVDWIDNAWVNFSPYGSLKQFYLGFAGTAGNFPLDKNNLLDMTLKGPDGTDINIRQTLTNMMNMNDTDMKKAGSQLAWIANENVLAISFFQNSSGFWYNSKTVKGLPAQDLVKKYDRNVPIPDDPKQLKEVNEHWYLWVAQDLKFVDGTLQPN